MSKLTRNKILKMEAGREMDALVAEKVFGGPEAHKDWYWWDGANMVWSNDTAYGAKPILIPALFAGPHFSTDISAAWEAVEKMKQGGHIFTFEMVTDDEDQYSAGFERKMEDYKPIWSGFGDTAPLAICRAALLAVVTL
jgi:hypothetical protein